MHFLNTANVLTFDQYADQVFLPYVMKQLESSRRVDVVWDKYIPTSIKESTREKRGKGMFRRSDFFPRRNFPLSDNEGGQGDFHD